MSELGELLGNGSYVFYKSLASSPNHSYQQAYSIGSARVNSIGTLIGGNIQATTIQNNSPEMQAFHERITAYLNLIEQVAVTMRNNEISYLKDIGQKIKDGSPLLSQRTIKVLEKIQNQERVSMADYNEMIVALNRIKYNEDIESFKKIISEQKFNIKLMQDNVNKNEQKADIEKAYKEQYGAYINKYGNIVNKARKTIKNGITKEVIAKQSTDLDALVKKINAALKNLSENNSLIEHIKEIYAEHLDDTTFTIEKSKFISYIIDSIIEEAEKNTEATGSQIGQTISKNIVQQLQQDHSLKNLISNSQASKITFRATTSATQQRAEKTDPIINALARGNRNLARLLLNVENAEEYIKKIFPQSTATRYIKELNEIKKEINSLEDSTDRKALNKILNNSGKTLSNKMKQNFRASDLGREIIQAIAVGGKIELSHILQDQKKKFLSDVKLQLQDLAIIVKKSSMAELTASKKVQDQISHIIFNDIGGSFNLKDDVVFALRTTTLPRAPTTNEIEKDLGEYTDNIDSIIEDTLGQYLTDYYARDKNDKYSDAVGSANVEKAKETYDKKIEELIIRLEKYYNTLDEQSQKELEEYAKTAETFFGSVSVKEYNLYLDELGFHGGTLGNTNLKALENIQKMYEHGGISSLDMKMLTLALINCSDAACGGSGLRMSLENYLLGGAALMMFDEGYGRAESFLNKLPDTIKSLVPKNINLYQLNGAYIPASFILETIHQNLRSFYAEEASNYTTDFMNRNKVVISNVGQISYTGDTDVVPWVQFENVADQVLAATNIQFIFMAGMLDIFKNLGKAFKVK